MTQAVLEHVNITVSDPVKTAALMCRLFDWETRWQGASKLGGYTVHVGGVDHYLAVYARPGEAQSVASSYDNLGGLNHVGVVVDNIEAVEARVVAEGFEPYNHGDYEPGRRFYFNDHDGVEFEVLSY